MDHGFFRGLKLKQATKWIWLFGIASVVLLIVEYYELPIFSGISFLISDTKASLQQEIYLYNREDKSLISHGIKDSATSVAIINSETSKDSVSGDVDMKNDSRVNNDWFSLSSSMETSIQNASSLTNLSVIVEKNPKMKTLPVMPISEMIEVLQKCRSSPHSIPLSMSSKVDQQLLEAKSQVENAAITSNDTGIHAPIYHNVSMFERSYEIMDQMLKVYIYKDGDKPIFHDGNLEGIYASEGWFIKLMEANKHFVTDNPSEAHLFYIPFSSRLLQLTLYVRHSHKRDNLIQFMKNHTEMLITKYPFWNRTDGSDHFLVGCHDWAPAETRGRLLNTFRALCNADIKAGFKIGNDVSLPATYVRSAKNPLKDVGGERPSNRPILAFFAGQMHGYVRPILLNHWGNDTDMRIFTRMPYVKGNKNYINHMKTSKYCICARGFAVYSPRVVESLFYNCVPVIISDNYVPPLFEVLNWESFAVFILEKDIPNLKQVLLSISHEKYFEMYERVKKVREHFLWHSEPVKYDLFHMILHSVWYNRVFSTNLS